MKEKIRRIERTGDTSVEVSTEIEFDSIEQFISLKMAQQDIMNGVFDDEGEQEGEQLH